MRNEQKSNKKIVKKLKNYYDDGYNIKIVWCYDEGDDDIISIGETFRKISGVPVEFFEHQD